MVADAPVRIPFRATYPPGHEFAQDPIPVVTHLHGGVTPSDSDGFVTAWFTKNEEKKGRHFTSSTFEYFNAQFSPFGIYVDEEMLVAVQGTLLGQSALITPYCEFKKIDPPWK